MQLGIANIRLYNLNYIFYILNKLFWFKELLWLLYLLQWWRITSCWNLWRALRKWAELCLYTRTNTVCFYSLSINRPKPSKKSSQIVLFITYSSGLRACYLQIFDFVLAVFRYLSTELHWRIPLYSRTYRVCPTEGYLWANQSISIFF